MTLKLACLKIKFNDLFLVGISKVIKYILRDRISVRDEKLIDLLCVGFVMHGGSFRCHGSKVCDCVVRQNKFKCT